HRPITAAPPSDAVAGDVRLHRWGLGFKQSGFHRIARALRAPDLRVFGPFSRSRRARVPIGFRRQVSRWPRGRSFRTSSIWDGDLPTGDVAHIIGVAHVPQAPVGRVVRVERWQTPELLPPEADLRAPPLAPPMVDALGDAR